MGMKTKVLIVDDEIDMQDLILIKFRQAVLEEEFDFMFALNGEEALAILKKDPEINIIMTDINMPVMDGLTLLSHLPKLNRTYKAVVVSAYGNISNIRQAMNQGASDFIMKPIDFADFETTLRKMIREYDELSRGLKASLHLKDLQKELDIARVIQESMLPNARCKNVPNFPQVSGRMIPAKEVGGDLFDYFTIDDDHLGLLIADVSGKSISACLYMVVTKALFRAFSKKSMSPLEVIKALNECLCSDNTSSMFVTAFYAILEIKTGNLTYCNAGHNIPYLVNKKGVKKIPSHNALPLGITTTYNHEMPRYQELTLQLNTNDRLLFYTDGVTEAMNEENEQFSEQRLESILLESNRDSVEDVLTKVMSKLKEFIGTASQSDDITMMYLGMQDKL